MFGNLRGSIDNEHTLINSYNSFRVHIMNEAVMLAALGIVSACVAGLIWVIKHLFSQVIPALNGLKKATDQNTAATKSADVYLRERNGRDNEHHSATLKAIKAIPSTMQTIADAQKVAIIKAVNVKEQSVTEQTVRHQTVQAQETK